MLCNNFTQAGSDNIRPRSKSSPFTVTKYASWDLLCRIWRSDLFQFGDDSVVKF